MQLVKKLADSISVQRWLMKSQRDTTVSVSNCIKYWKRHHSFCFKWYYILEEMCPWLFTINYGVAFAVHSCSLPSLFFICTLQLLVSAHPFTSTSSSASAPHYAVLVACNDVFFPGISGQWITAKPSLSPYLETCHVSILDENKSESLW